MGAMTAVFAEGWDDGLVGPITRAAAGARDAAGEPYTVVFVVDGRRHAVLDISWGDGYCGLDRFDAAGRRISRHELRRSPDGDLYLREARTWSGAPGAGVHEFPHVAHRHVTIHRLSGELTEIDEPEGDRGSRHRSDTTGGTPPRLPIPAFGRWQALLELAGDTANGHLEIADAVPQPFPVRPAAGRPWEPPRPLRPRGIEQLFTAGTERTVSDRRMRISTHPAGRLNLPSGRIIAADPSSLDDDEEPFLVTVAAGTYPVTIALATFLDDPGHSRVCAARLEITDRPAATWELALRDGQDPMDLGAGEFYGFGVDAGVACFVDADNAERLSDEWEDLPHLLDPRFTTVAGGDMVAWSSGWGDGFYPTWIGRDETGAVTSFVADMLLFPSRP